MFADTGPSLKDRQEDELAVFGRRPKRDLKDACYATLATLHSFEQRIENRRHNLTVITPEMVIKEIKDILLGPANERP
jgi:hypothetical protein